MGDKKHIDRLFQEKLKDFEATPNDAVWESIERRLHEKKRKRRVFPLWWQMAGVAAILALMFTVGNLMIKHDPDTVTTPTVVNSEDVEIPNATTSDQSIQNEEKDETVANNGTDTEELNSDSKISAIADETKNKSSTIANTRTNSYKVGEDYNAGNSVIDQSIKNPENAITEASAQKGDEVINSSNLPELDQINSSKQSLAEQKPLGNPQKVDINGSAAGIKPDDNTLDIDNANKEIEAQSIEDAITEADNSDEKEKEEKFSRWNVSTNVAPVYFNSIGNGSSLDEQLINNSKSGEINMSYGVNGSYAVNKNLRIRSGINKVTLGYSTNDVVVYKSAGISAIASQSRSNGNITFDDKSESTSIISAQNLSFATVPEIMATNINSSLNQEFGFIELPLEVEYAILNEKFGVNVIGGFSTFFLDNNKVYSTVNGEKSLLGEANNINDTSYSANFGLGVNYNISEKIKFNLEPTFKYQFNTFRDTSGDFRPYFIGIYTGLSYKF